MRRFLFAIALLGTAPAMAQTQAARPVEPFSYGIRAGTPSNPFYAVLSSVIPPAGAATQAAAPVELFSYGRRVGTQDNPLYVNLTGDIVSNGNVTVGKGSSIIMQSTQGVHLALTYAFGAIVATSSDGSPVQLIMDSYRETPRTPASATDSCQPGQWADDGAFKYFCKATNTWVTIPYSATFQGPITSPVAGDVTGASVVPAGGSSVNLGTYLGSLATLAELQAARVGVYPDDYYETGDTDDGPSFVRAISALCSKGGGILNIAPRHYAVSATVTLPCPVQIRGAGWQSGFAASGAYDYSAAAGSWIDVKTDSSTSPISISGTPANGASVEDVAFFYAVPGTTTAGVFTPTTQAPTIAVANVGGDVSIRNVFMPGTYSGVMADNAGRVNIDGLYGQFFNYAYQTDNDYDVTRVNNVHSWVYWSQDAPIVAWQQLNTKVIRLGRVDIPFIDHIFAFAAWSGIQTFQGTNGVANGVSVGTLSCDSTVHCLDIGAAANTISIANLREFGQAGISSGVPYSNATAIAFESAGYGDIQVGNLEARMIDAAPIWSGATSGCSSVRIANLLEDFSASQESVAHTSVEPTTCAAGGNLSVYLGNTPNVILKASGQTMVHSGDNAKTYFAAQVQQ